MRGFSFFLVEKNSFFFAYFSPGTKIASTRNKLFNGRQLCKYWRNKRLGIFRLNSEFEFDWLEIRDYVGRGCPILIRSGLTPKSGLKPVSDKNKTFSVCKLKLKVVTDKINFQFSLFFPDHYDTASS